MTTLAATFQDWQEYLLFIVRRHVVTSWPHLTLAVSIVKANLEKVRWLTRLDKSQTKPSNVLAKLLFNEKDVTKCRDNFISQNVTKKVHDGSWDWWEDLSRWSLHYTNFYSFLKSSRTKATHILDVRRQKCSCRDMAKEKSIKKSTYS